MCVIRKPISPITIDIIVRPLCCCTHGIGFVMNDDADRLHRPTRPWRRDSRVAMSAMAKNCDALHTRSDPNWDAR